MIHKNDNVMFQSLIRSCVELTVMSKNTTAVKYSIEVSRTVVLRKWLSG